MQLIFCFRYSVITSLHAFLKRLTISFSNCRGGLPSGHLHSLRYHSTTVQLFSVNFVTCSMQLIFCFRYSGITSLHAFLKRLTISFSNCRGGLPSGHLHSLRYHSTTVQLFSVNFVTCSIQLIFCFRYSVITSLHAFLKRLTISFSNCRGGLPSGHLHSLRYHSTTVQLFSVNFVTCSMQLIFCFRYSVITSLHAFLKRLTISFSNCRGGLPSGHLHSLRYHSTTVQLFSVNFVTCSMQLIFCFRYSGITSLRS